LSLKTPRFDWDQANIAHLARHGVTPEKVEEAFCDPFQLLLGTQLRDGEVRYEMMAETKDGRILEVVLTHRRGAIRPVTAYTASRRDRSFYQEARRDQDR